MSEQSSLKVTDKEKDARVALSLAKTVAGGKSLAAAANRTNPPSTMNSGGPIGPVPIPAFAAPQALTAKVSGFFDVTGMISGTSTPGIGIDITLLRNGVPIGPTVTVTAAPVTGSFYALIAWTDQPGAGVAALYSIQADTAGAGGTVPTDGASMEAHEIAA